MNRRPNAIQLPVVYRTSLSSRVVVVEHPRPVAPNNDGNPPQDRYLIRGIDRETGITWVIGSSRMGFNDLDSAIIRCCRMDMGA